MGVHKHFKDGGGGPTTRWEMLTPYRQTGLNFSLSILKSTNYRQTILILLFCHNCPSSFHCLYIISFVVFCHALRGTEVHFDGHRSFGVTINFREISRGPKSCYFEYQHFIFIQNYEIWCLKSASVHQHMDKGRSRSIYIYKISSAISKACLWKDFSLSWLVFVIFTAPDTKERRKERKPYIFISSTSPCSSQILLVQPEILDTKNVSDIKQTRFFSRW